MRLLAFYFYKWLGTIPAICALKIGVLNHVRIFDGLIQGRINWNFRVEFNKAHLL